MTSGWGGAGAHPVDSFQGLPHAHVTVKYLVPKSKGSRSPIGLVGGWVCVCVYYCRTYYKAVRVGEEESGGHVL